MEPGPRRRPTLDSVLLPAVARLVFLSLFLFYFSGLPLTWVRLWGVCLEPLPLFISPPPPVCVLLEAKDRTLFGGSRGVSAVVGLTGSACSCTLCTTKAGLTGSACSITLCTTKAMLNEVRHGGSRDRKRG